MKKPLESPKEAPKLRQIVIETNGSEIWIRKAETTRIELAAICNMVIASIGKEKKEPETTQ